MAITGDFRKIDTQLRDNLSKSMTSDNFISAVGYQSIAEVGITGDKLAGIKPGFKEKLTEAIDNYIASINKKIDELETNPNIAQAFKGDGIESAIKRLISAVKEEAHAYTNELKKAEQSIIVQVEQMYSAQANTVSENMNADTSKLGH